MAEIKKVIIVGGGASGMACAARLRRLDEQLKIVIVEKGKVASYAQCGMPYHVGGTIKEEKSLYVTPLPLIKKFYNFDIRLETEVTKIDPKEKTVFMICSGKETVEEYDKLMLCQGAKTFVPPIKGVKECKNVFSLGNIAEMKKVKEKVEWASSAVVVGAGFIGIEIAEQLKHFGLEKVRIVELLPHILPPIDKEMANIVEKELKTNGIDISCNSVVQGVQYLEDKDDVEIEIQDRITQKSEKSNVDMVIICTGIRPNGELAKASGIKCSKFGHVEVNNHLQTSDPNIFAMGDLITFYDRISEKDGYCPLAQVANIHGRLVANFLYNKKPDTFKGSIGTSFVKIFRYMVASIGYSEERCKRFNIPYEKIYTFGGDHPNYMPLEKDSIPRNQSIKLLFNRDGKILGCQIVGLKGVDAVSNTITTAMNFDKKVQDLIMLELPYCPYAGHAKNVVQNLGSVATGIIDGTHKHITVEELVDSNGELKKEYILVDVRPKFMWKMFPPMKGAISIPIPTLRSKMNQFKKDDNIVFACNIGKKAYWCSRMFQLNGFKNAKFCTGSAFLYNRGYI